MTFTPKDWRNRPDETTPINAPALENMEVRLGAYTDSAIQISLDPIEGNIGIYVPPATGNATTDTANIAAAVTAVSARSTLRFPPNNTYVVTKTGGTFQTVALIATAGVKLCGNGARIQLDSGAAVGTIIFGITAADVEISGFEFDANAISQAAGVRFEAGADRANVHHNKFASARAQVLTAHDVTIADNVFDSTASRNYGVCTDTSSSPQRLGILRNVFRGIATNALSSDAIEIDTNLGLASGGVINGNRIYGYAHQGSTDGIGIGCAHVENFSITNNYIEGCGLDGIHVEDGSTGVTVSNNVVKGCQRAGITMNSSNAARYTSGNVVSDNIVRGCNLSAGEGAIELAGTQRNVGTIIRGNRVDGCGPGGTTRLGGISLGVAYDSVIESNVCSNQNNGTLAAGIVVASPMNNCMIQGNRCYDDQGVKTQHWGINFVGTGHTDSLVAHNNVRGNLSGQLGGSTNDAGLIRRDNVSPNPGFVTAPAIPATTVAQTNTFPHDCTVYVSGGTVSSVSVGGTNTGLIAGTFYVRRGQTITLAYTVAPTWKWHAEEGS